MIDPEPDDLDEPGSALAELSEQITRRLQAGEPVDLEDLQDQDPTNTDSGSIRGLLPTLRDLTDLGRSMARRSSRSPAPDHR